VVVGPPQALERHDGVVAAELLLAGELEGVRDRVQRLHGLGEPCFRVGVAVAVDHEVLEGRDIHDPELAAAGAVALEAALVVDLVRHTTILSPASDGGDATPFRTSGASVASRAW
jgi:hypothetical protein